MADDLLAPGDSISAVGVANERLQDLLGAPAAEAERQIRERRDRPKGEERSSNRATAVSSRVYPIGWSGMRETLVATK
jgi:hypothetical protein